LPEEKPALPSVQGYYDRVFRPIYVENPGAIAASTAASYVKNFKTHILPALGSRRLDEVNHDHMEMFVADLVKKTRQTRKKKTEADAENPIVAEPQPTLAKATIQTVVKQLCKFFNHARKRELVTDNPASGLSQLYSQAAVRHEVVEPLTREEVPLFLAAARKHAPQHYALFFTDIHTGLRAGELAGLQAGDIDFNGKYAIIQRSIDRVHRKGGTDKTQAHPTDRSIRRASGGAEGTHPPAEGILVQPRQATAGMALCQFRR